MNKFFKTVLLTSLLVGTTDLMYAIISIYIGSGKFPYQMLNYIAGGALGLQTSMKGGTSIAFLGLFFHYVIAYLYTLFFFIIFPRLKFLSFNKYLVGILYGVFVNVSMNQLVLRLTMLPAKTNAFNLTFACFDWIIFGIIFGIPITYNAYKLNNRS